MKAPCDPDKKSDLYRMAKAFGTNINGLAAITGYSRKGLNIRGRTCKSRLDAVRNALYRYGNDLHETDLMLAEKHRLERETWIEKLFSE